jgi:hypothetical protein
VIALAAAQYSLHPALVTAFVLAEARDQSRNEDAKDLTAARAPVVQANTSIGLGQIVISTARREGLFSDLLSASYRGGLSHNQTALLLASEEINIFGVAKYVRVVANRGASMAASALPNTVAEFPRLNLGLYSAHSSAWPDDNVRVLGMYYTSRAWSDDLRSAGWGEFVFEAYRDAKSTGIFP